MTIIVASAIVTVVGGMFATHLDAKVHAAWLAFRATRDGKAVVAS